MGVSRLDRRHRYPIVAVSVCLLQFACASASEQTMIGEGPRGAVYLERLSVRGATAKYSGPLGSFHATHPVALSPDLLALAFRGLQIGPIRTEKQESSPLPVPLFTEEDAAFLAPFITTALSRATPDQRVRFLALSERGGLVQGTLFVDHPLLHVTLSRYQPRNAAPPIALDKMELSSIHRSAHHRDNAPQSWMLHEAGLPSISLDYQVLKNLPAPQPGTQAAQPLLPATGPSAARDTASPSQAEIDSMKELMTRQADEIQKLKEEVEALRRQSPAGQARPPKQSGKKKPAPSNQHP